MATLDFSIDANTSPAIQEVRKLQNSIDVLKTSFAGLQNAIAGLAIGNFIQRTVQMGAQLDALSKSTGIAADTIRGFQMAVVASGGSSDQASDAIATLVKNIGDAATGSDELRNAFAKVGVTFEDIKKLSEEDILKKTIAGLNAIPDKATRTATALKLMEEGMKGVDIGNLGQSLNSYIAQSAGIGAASAAAAASQANLTVAMMNFQNAVLEAIDPISEFMSKLDATQLARFMESLILVAEVAAGLFVFSKVTTILKGFVEAVSSVAKAGEATTTAMGGLKNILAFLLSPLIRIWDAFKELTTVSSQSASHWGALGNLIKSLGSGIIRFIPIVGGLIAGLVTLNEAFGLFSGTDYDFVNWVKKGLENLGILEKGTAKTLTQIREERAKEIQSTAEAKRQKENERNVIDSVDKAYQSLYKSLRMNVDAYKQANFAQLERISLQTDLIGKTEEEKAVRQGLFDLEQGISKKLIELEAQRADAKLKAASANDVEKQTALKMLPEIEKAIQDVTSAYIEQRSALQEVISENAKRLEQYNQEMALSNFVFATQSSNANAMNAIYDEMAKSTMTEVEKKYYDIVRAARDSAKAAIDQENSRRRSLKLAQMTSEEEAAYYKTSTKGMDELLKKQKQSYEQSRTWATGWKKAFKDYIAAANDGASKAASLFNKATQGMEDVLVNFVKTGKFEWKGFVESILEELLRGQIQGAIASALGPLADLMGFDISGLTGKSPGGTPNNPMYVLDVSGGGAKAAGGIASVLGGGTTAKPASTGGGLMEGIKSVASNVGKVASGIWDSVTSVASSAWDAVSGIGSAIGDMFGGWFANGGTLGAGKWGIAGEAGPELITGPATITPLNGGGVTSVTYNINAVDAMSFKAMIAADPGFIHAVASQGARSIPGRR